MDQLIKSSLENYEEDSIIFYNKEEQVKAFDETKTGVKGLVDSGITKIPKFFIHTPENPADQPSSEIPDFGPREVPVIDFEGHENSEKRRVEIVEEIRNASKNWGFFQMVNHGVPVNVLDEMIEDVKKFHEEYSKEVKMEWYSRDRKKKVRFFSNGDLLVNKGPANWRDTLAFEFHDGELDPDLYPEICREGVKEYMKQVIKTRKMLSEMLSEALGLESDYLSKLECMETESLVCHYYPVCPEPELTLGATMHTDPSFITILLQDNIGGLQVLDHHNHWVHVPPMKGALVINIGDFLQLVSNDKFKSVKHRVIVGKEKARTSVACLFYPSTANKLKPYGPIKQLVSSSNPPIYKETTHSDYLAFFRSNNASQHAHSNLPHFQLP